MSKDIEENLEHLQELDTAIDRLTARLESLPEAEALVELEARRAELEAQIAEVQQEADTIEHDRKKIDDELEIVSSKLKKEEEKLYSGSVVNPKELADLSQEITMLRKHVAEHEDQELEVMEKADEVSGRLEEARTRMGELGREIAQVESDKEAAVRAIQEELAVLRPQREAAAGAIGPELLEEYDQVRQACRGLAVVWLHEGVCQGCHVELPAEKYDRILHSQELAYCPNCRRLLIRE